MSPSFLYLITVAIAAKAVMAGRDSRSSGGSGWQGSSNFGGGAPSFGATRTASQWSGSGNYGDKSGGWGGTSSLGLNDRNVYPSRGGWNANGRSSNAGFEGKIPSSNGGWAGNSGGWTGSGTPNAWRSLNLGSRSSKGWQSSGW